MKAEHLRDDTPEIRIEALQADQKRLNNILKAWKRGGWSVQLQIAIETALEGTETREEIKHLK